MLTKSGSLRFESKMHKIYHFFTYLYLGKDKKGGAKLDDLKKALEVDVHKIPLEELFRRFGVNRQTGLTDAQAKAGIEKHGHNCEYF